MNEKDIVNRVRGLGFMAGVLENQGHEPLCLRCISYAITVEETREALQEIRELVSTASLPEEFVPVLRRAEESIVALSVPGEPERQRKIGRCHFPDNSCFVKKARMIFLFFKEKQKR